MRYVMLWAILPILLLPLKSNSQKVSDATIQNRIEAYKSDRRGPYKYLRWYCFDGRVNPPNEPCGNNQGVQRAAYKDEVVALGKTNHIFLGQILASTPKEEFLDADYNYSRLKQYQLEQFLRNADDGWVLRRAQYYRGAFQAEDEEAWGVAFFNWLLEDDDILKKHFFLFRQAAKDIPHAGDDDKTQEMRAISKALADSYSPFMNLRVKIHGQPDASDVPAVEKFYNSNKSKLSSTQRKEFEDLLAVMRDVYKPIDLRSLSKYVNKLPANLELRAAIQQYIDNYAGAAASPGRITATAEMLWKIRQDLSKVSGAEARLAMLDLSNRLELVMLRDLPGWQTNTIGDLLDQTCHQALAAAGCGFLETWEWDKISKTLSVPKVESLTLKEMTSYLESARRIVEWGTGMTRATYDDVIDLFDGFEPLAHGFIDDRIRSSVLLPLGDNVGRLGNVISTQSAMANQVMNLNNQSTIRGLNPGYSFGELVVITGSAENLDVSKDKIYIMEQPPSDLKPVAGIATVSEGNMVSHVQLLARNLGIPNAVVSLENVNQLKRYAGQKVFYAVSSKGRVIMKPESAMTAQEKALFTEEAQERSDNRVTVPVDKVRLDQTTILNMRDVKATDSGKLCGPKAANLGQLKSLFPEHVVEGFVIPFGIFRKHLDQPMPGKGMTYWAYLNDAFKQADQQRQSGKSESEVEAFTLKQLDVLRRAILEMPLLPEFQADLENSFKNILGVPMGAMPVFLRSDTNMEDLKEFTGAGLNLTLFNVLKPEAIIDGIKQVWASPYTERSFKWRQRYLLNPENVFPSILVIPGVNNDCSGVMITKGITTGNPNDVTIAFSRGVGGAVEGQMAESYVLKEDGTNQLLSPSREAEFTILPATGGTEKEFTSFESRVLTPYHLSAIRQFVPELKRILPTAPGIETEGPFDVELGFKNNKLWLFQARPFVENKSANASEYLDSLNPNIPEDKAIRLSTSL